jgi:acetyl-CoA acyltransferase
MISPARQAVIVDGVRTPFGRAHAEKGWFRRVRADELAANCLRELIARNELDPQWVDEVIVGCALQTGELALNAARQISLLAGLPVTCPAVTVNRLCGSSLQALHQAVHAIEAGQADVQLVAGVEKMTGQPPPIADALHPRLSAVTSPAALSMGLTAEFLARRFGISRADQDAWALRSHQRAAATAESQSIASSPATQHLRLKPEVSPVWGHDEAGERKLVTHDQCVRHDTSLEALAKLPPAFVKSSVAQESEAGHVTAGNSSPRNDGAAALLVMSRERASELGYEPLAIVRAGAVVGISPCEMGLGPVPATKRVLKNAGLSLRDIGPVELNEAFAAQVLACMRQIGVDPEKVNQRGGAIAIGHPLGASGARLILSLIHSLQTDKAEFGLAAMCIGMGQGIATILQRV